MRTGASLRREMSATAEPTVTARLRPTRAERGSADPGQWRYRRSSEGPQKIFPAARAHRGPRSAERERAGRRSGAGRAAQRLPRRGRTGTAGRRCAPRRRAREQRNTRGASESARRSRGACAIASPSSMPLAWLTTISGVGMSVSVRAPNWSSALISPYASVSDASSGVVTTRTRSAIEANPRTRPAPRRCRRSPRRSPGRRPRRPRRGARGDPTRGGSSAPGRSPPGASALRPDLETQSVGATPPRSRPRPSRRRRSGGR